jgi:hypothetical protein
MRQNLIDTGIEIPNSILCEKMYQLCLNELGCASFPIKGDIAFDNLYMKVDALLRTTKIRELTGFPVSKNIGCLIQDYQLIR